jgi:hypothetical protein
MSPVCSMTSVEHHLEKTDTRARQFWLIGLAALLSFGAFWVTLLAHEAAHFVVARAVYTGGELSAGRPRPASQLATVAAGPLVTLAILVASALATRARRRLRVRLVLNALAGGAAARLLLIGPGTLIGSAANDERTMGRLLGVPPQLIWSVEAGVGALCLAVTLRSLPPSERPVLTAAVTAGIVLGIATAFSAGRAIGLPV